MSNKIDRYYNPFKEPKSPIPIYDMEKGLKALKRAKTVLKRKDKDKAYQKLYYKIKTNQ